MNSKWKNGGVLLAVFTLIVYLLANFFGIIVPQWTVDLAVGAIMVLWLMGIVSNPTTGMFWNFKGVPILKRLEDPTVIKALGAWIVMLLANLNNIFHWLPVTADLNAFLQMILGVMQMGGFFRAFDKEELPAGGADPAATIPPMGGATDGAGTAATDRGGI